MKLTESLRVSTNFDAGTRPVVSKFIIVVKYLLVLWPRRLHNPLN